MLTSSLRLSLVTSQHPSSSRTLCSAWYTLLYHGTAGPTLHAEQIVDSSARLTGALLTPDEQDDKEITAAGRGLARGKATNQGDDGITNSVLRLLINVFPATQPLLRLYPLCVGRAWLFVCCLDVLYHCAYT